MAGLPKPIAKATRKKSRPSSKRPRPSKKSGGGGMRRGY